MSRWVEFCNEELFDLSKKISVYCAWAGEKKSGLRNTEENPLQ